MLLPSQEPKTGVITLEGPDGQPRSTTRYEFRDSSRPLAIQPCPRSLVRATRYPVTASIQPRMILPKYLGYERTWRGAGWGWSKWHCQGSLVQV